MPISWLILPLNFILIDLIKGWVEKIQCQETGPAETIFDPPTAATREFRSLTLNYIPFSNPHQTDICSLHNRFKNHGLEKRQKRFKKTDPIKIVFLTCVLGG